MPIKPGVQEIFTTRDVLAITVTFSGGLGTTTKRHSLTVLGILEPPRFLLWCLQRPYSNAKTKEANTLKQNFLYLQLVQTTRLKLQERMNDWGGDCKVQ